MTDKVKINCLVCGEVGEAKEEINLWEEKIMVLRCTHCQSIITSTDGIHWHIFYQCNKWREETER